jgi:hypothetical protein
MYNISERISKAQSPLAIELILDNDERSYVLVFPKKTTLDQHVVHNRYFAN